MHNTLAILTVLLLSYLLGSLNFAILVSRLRGLADPRSYGSGNPGATNMLRSGDRKAAALTLLGDALKGLLALVLMRWALTLPALNLQSEGGLSSAAWLSLASIGVFLGHLYPIFFRFQGGKGVATALGVLLGLQLWLGLAALSAWLLMLAIARQSALSALTAALVAPIAAALGLRPDASLHPAESPVFWSVLAMAVLLVWRHRRNIAEMRAKPSR